MNKNNKAHPNLSDVGIKTIQDAIGDYVVNVILISDPTFKKKVLDHTYKYLVKTDSGKQYVLIESNPHFPLMVSTAVAKLQKARVSLNSGSREVIEKPVYHGFMGEISYALWQRRYLYSDNRLYRLLQKKLLFIKVSSWLRIVAKETFRNKINRVELQTGFIDPLNTLKSKIKSNYKIQGAIHGALESIERHRINPGHILQHGDLWKGNILLVSFFELFNPMKRGFIVIDWGGSKINGYPFFDLIRFLMSCEIGPKVAKQHIRSMAKQIGCSNSDVSIYLLCALGKLGQELNNFAVHRYLRMCRDMWEYIQKI